MAEAHGFTVVVACFVLGVGLAACGSGAASGSRGDGGTGIDGALHQDGQLPDAPGLDGSGVDVPGSGGSGGSSAVDGPGRETGAGGMGSEGGVEGGVVDSATALDGVPIDSAPLDLADAPGGGSLGDAATDALSGGDALDSPTVFPCQPGWTLCGETCVDTATDPQHCGGCATLCGGGKVCTGSCTCPTGQVECNGFCTDTQVDPNNCLACGTLCTGGKECSSLLGCRCPQGKTECSGICVDTQSSPLDCGTCGKACPATQICTAGTCGCPLGQIDCGDGLCVDLATDPANCGICRKACATGQVCAAGLCACAAGRTECGAGVCADLTSDPANCGGCGVPCDPGRVCNGGQCSTQCTPGLANCDGACVDLQTSAAHCGTCATVCTTDATCAAGHCACVSGRTDCSGVCVNLLSDKANCATCGHACPGTSFCEGGACKCVPGYDLCGETCVDVQWDKDHCGNCATACTGGKMCTEGTCVCPPPQVECNGVCANTMTDLANCGSCGHVCDAGLCSSGRCTCPPYQSSCNGQCIPTANDPLNCGSCGHACSTGQVCISNACTGSCYGGLTACNGTCVDVASDRNHCGNCATVCGAGTGCAGGNCVTSVALGPAPAKCVGGGPPIMLTADGTTTTCAGQTAATTFPWAICACDSFTGKGSQSFDAYDSTQAPYLPGGLGGGIGVNGTYSGGSSMTCTGTLWSYQSINPGNATIRQELHVGGLLDGNVAVGGTGYVVTPHDRGSFAGDLYSRTCPAPGYTVAGTCHADPALTVPIPCQRCEGANQVPVQGYVSYYSVPAHNDNAAIGLSPSTFSSGGAATVLDLPCGYYYLDRIVAEGSVTIAAHGNTALFIGGSVDVKGALVLALDSSSRFDVFVAGTVYADGTLTMGSAAFPANLRVYIGGACKGTGGACVQKGDCCSAVCTAGACSGTSLLPDDPPWAMYMKAATNIAADIYTPNGEMYAGASFAMYGAIFAGDYKANGSTTIHYDRAAVDQGATCPPTSGCGSCLDCNNQACINGTCGQCTNSSQCCPPLICVDGRCDIGLD